MNNWFKNAIVYHIFIDRFAGYKVNADAKKPLFCGGRLNAITDKIDYIKGMGFNTIWVSPFYETSAYHGYHITNFDKVDKRFGHVDDLRKLISECHRKQVRIIADIVPNHCSETHPFFIDAKLDKLSKFRNWFYFENWPEKYIRFLDFGELPKINLENPETATYMIDSLSSWAKLGFDGFRIDHIMGLPDNFLLKLKNELLQLNNEFILIGEAWNEGICYKHLKTLRAKGRYRMWKTGMRQADIQKHYLGIVDGVLDFGWRNLLLKNLYSMPGNKQTFLKLEREYCSTFPDGFYLPRFLDNHDTNRIMYSCKNNEKLFKLSLELLTGQEQPIIVYNGTEYGLSHSLPLTPETPYSDLQARGLIPWEQTGKYTQFITRLLKARINKQKL
ncbi:MAG: hypothetical protein JXB34_13820 [Bacteroidales bacterium]|nr:hypothetical protein [Bacteroidales bacterium]